MSGDQSARILAAVDHTQKAGTASVTLEAWFESPDTSSRSAGVPPRTLMGRLGWKGFSALVKKLVDAAGKRSSQAEGILDFAGRRCAVDYGGYGLLVAGSRSWTGYSGDPISTRPEGGPHAMSPLWLFDLLRGVTKASHVGSEAVGGRPCARFAAQSDLGRVAAAVPDDTALAPSESFEGLRRLSLDVWIDEESYVRRISFEHSARTGFVTGAATELYDFGNPNRIDWSRLPRLKATRPTPTAALRAHLVRIQARLRSAKTRRTSNR